MAGRPASLKQGLEVLPNLSHCPKHPQWITLPWHSYRTCCLVEALEQIRDAEVDARAIATAALQPPDKRIVVGRIFGKKRS